MNYKLLSIDETGKASYEHSSDLFIVSGVVLPEKLKEKLDRKTRKIKKKYFNNEDIVFHSRDMTRRKGPFIALQDPKNEMAFWAEFVSLLNNTEISLFFIISNKDNAKKLSWQPKTILKKSYLKLLEGFATHLNKSKSKGKIIVESDPSQDIFLIKSHNRLQAMGTSDRSISGKVYKEMVTSLSLVNKGNFDIDVQIADALAPIAGLKYRVDILKKQRGMLKAEKMKKRLIDRKLTDKSNPSVFEVLI